MSVFKLPDLGEGLQEAEIREWLVQAGDEVLADQPLVSVETAKAVVEVPSPRAGRITRLCCNAGDILEVGKPLIEFASAETPSAVSEPSGAPAAATEPAVRDSAAVVGAMKSGNEVVAERATSVHSGAGLKVTPAVRALAHRLNVDLGIVTPTGPDGMITQADVQRVHRILTEVGPLELLRGPRRAMAKTMSQARDEVMQTTVTDDAVLHAWNGRQDLTVRLIRAMVAAVRAEPSLNAWFDSHEVGRRVIEAVHLGVAVDTPDGLYVAVLQNVHQRDAHSLREGLRRMKEAAMNHAMPPEELRGFTITLSNFGRFGGKYATPVVVPPTVAIVAAGAMQDAVVPVNGEIRIAPVVPLSLAFDHRAVNGGEATRFLAALKADLEQPD